MSEDRKINLRRLSQRDLVDMIGKAREIRKDHEEAEEKLKAELARRHGEEVRNATQIDPTGYTGKLVRGQYWQCTLTWCERLVLDTDKVRNYLGPRVGRFEKESNHFTVITERQPPSET